MLSHDTAPTVAIDRAVLPRYGRDSSRRMGMTNLIKCRLVGTSIGEAYIIAKIVGHNCTALNVTCHPVTRTGFDPYFVRKMIDELMQCHIRPDLLLLDRGFFAVNVIRTISRVGLKFLMPAVKNSGIKKAIAGQKRDCLRLYDKVKWR